MWFFYKSWKKSIIFKRIKESMKKWIFDKNMIFLDIVTYVKYWEKYQNVRIISFSDILWFFCKKIWKLVFLRKFTNLWIIFGNQNPWKAFFLKSTKFNSMHWLLSGLLQLSERWKLSKWRLFEILIKLYFQLSNSLTFLLARKQLS
jgi:hypothetical protein